MPDEEHGSGDAECGRKHHGAAGYAATKRLYVLSALLRGALFGPLAWMRGDAKSHARLRLAGASLRFHLAGQEPVT